MISSRTPDYSPAVLIGLSMDLNNECLAVSGSDKLPNLSLRHLM